MKIMKINKSTALKNTMLVFLGLASISCIAYAIMVKPSISTLQSASATTPRAPTSAAALPAATRPENASVNVAWFLEWATPMQLAKLDGRFDEALGVSANWNTYATGAEMSDAMLAGEIDIAYSQGLAPFTSAVNAGVPITMVAVAVGYGSNNDCIIRGDAGIDPSNAVELEGRSIAVPVNTMADFAFRMTMDSLGVDTEAVTVLDRDPEDGAAALVSGEVVMACGWGAESLETMRTAGSSMLSAAEKVEAGITSFDIVSVRDDFLHEHPDQVEAFLRIVTDANAVFDLNSSRIEEIAADAGLSVEVARQQLEGFEFPGVELQRDRYFGENGLVLDMLGFMGHMFATDEAPALDDYSVVVDSHLLR